MFTQEILLPVDTTTMTPMPGGAFQAALTCQWRCAARPWCLPENPCRTLVLPQRCNFLRGLKKHFFDDLDKQILARSNFARMKCTHAQATGMYFAKCHRHQWGWRNQ
jgi:hypothetical protein